MTERMFTEDEAMHLVAREVAKQRMSDMERKIADNDHKVTVALAKLEQQIGQVITMIDKQSLEQNKSVKDLREEIEKEFASKLDLQRVENKIDQLWVKIATSIVVVSIFSGVVGWIISTAINATKVLGH